MNRRLLAAAVAVLALTGCSDSTGTAPPTARPAAAVSAPLDVTALPLGAPPGVTFLGSGELHWRGRTVATDFPGDALYADLLGVAGGRLVVTAYQGRGTRFWAIDRSGHAERLGGTYDSTDHAPALVASTGHLWIHAGDRTTPWRLTELDARTGRELATYRERPTGLAPADQALVDRWLDGRPDPSPLRDRDGSLTADVRTRLDGTGVTTAHLRVRTSDGDRLARFSFDLGTQGTVDRVAFEGVDHVLALVTASYARRTGPAQVVVRCAVTTQTCERATEVGGVMALRR